MNNVVDLDVLRPEPRIVKLGGNELDVSFVPCAITFELEQLVQDMAKLSVEKIVEGDGEQARKGFAIGVDLCVLFCRHKHPEMTRQWFLDNTDATQVGAFAEVIKEALTKSYEGVDRYRNPQTAKTKKRK
jgi:hypothetical protein